MSRTALAITLGLLAGPVALTVGGAQPAGPAPVATVKQVQEAMVSPASDTLFDVGRQAPRSDEEWLVVRNAAVVLAEAGNLFMMEGRARDADQWMTLSQELVDAGTDALRAAEARSVEGVLAAGDRIAAACEACHQPYRDGGRTMGPPPSPDASAR